MNIKGKDYDFSQWTGEDLYIMSLSKEERDKLNLSVEQKNLPYLTLQDMRDILKFRFERLILIYEKETSGKSTYEIYNFANELKEFNDFVNKVAKATSAVQEAQKQKMKKVPYSADFRKTLADILKWAKANDIDIDIQTTTIEGKDRQGNPTKVEKIVLQEDPDLAATQLNNISNTLQAEIKKISTKASKAQSDMSTKVEISSSIMKRYYDAIQSILQKVS